MWPFLIDNLKEVIKELQDFAEKRYNAEEAECPQRAMRLTTANNGAGCHNASVKQSRTLTDITNEKHMFVRYIDFIMSMLLRISYTRFDMILLYKLYGNIYMILFTL